MWSTRLLTSKDLKFVWKLDLWDWIWNYNYHERYWLGGWICKGRKYLAFLLWKLPLRELKALLARWLNRLLILFLGNSWFVKDICDQICKKGSYSLLNFLLQSVTTHCVFSLLMQNLLSEIEPCLECKVTKFQVGTILTCYKMHSIGKAIRPLLQIRSHLMFTRGSFDHPFQITKKKTL